MLKKNKLFEQFPPVSTDEWMEKIKTDLKGADFREKLVWKTNDGFDVMPFYRKENTENLKYIDSLPGQFPFIRGKKATGNIWKIRQNIIVNDYSTANNKALEILMKGVDSVGFVIPDPETITEKNFNILLRDIMPEAAELNFLSNGRAKEIVKIFHEHISAAGFDPVKISGAVETDPLGRLLLNGTLCIPVNQGFDYLAEVTKLTAPLKEFYAIHLNASNFRNAGATISEEIAFAISAGAEYLRQLISRGIKADDAAGKIRFSFGTGSEYFAEIAKLRAARLLWSAVVNGFSPDNIDAARMEIHCVTGRWNKTSDKAHTNILRNQTEAMSAILGGADSVTVEPFDIVNGK